MFKGILEFLRFKRTRGGDGRLTNWNLYHQLVGSFQESLPEFLVPGRIIFPMSFNIFLSPDDYDNVKDSLPFVLPEVIRKFYKIIRKELRRKRHYIAPPPATYWFFQFVSSKVGKDGKSAIPPGFVEIWSSVNTFDIEKAQRGVETSTTVVTVKRANSDVIKNNINPDDLLGVDILGHGAFKYKFDKDMNPERSAAPSRPRERAGSVLATLTYERGGKTLQLEMRDELITLSGPEDTRTGDDILIIENEAVEKAHVMIKYHPDTHLFKLCAYGSTRLNMREVPLSAGGKAIWVDMAYHSDIFLNGTVNVKFKASPSIVSKA